MTTSVDGPSYRCRPGDGADRRVPRRPRSKRCGGTRAVRCRRRHVRRPISSDMTTLQTCSGTPAPNAARSRSSPTSIDSPVARPGLGESSRRCSPAAALRLRRSAGAAGESRSVPRARLPAGIASRPRVGHHRGQVPARRPREVRQVGGDGQYRTVAISSCSKWANLRPRRVSASLGVDDRWRRRAAALRSRVITIAAAQPDAGDRRRSPRRQHVGEPEQRRTSRPLDADVAGGDETSGEVEPVDRSAGDREAGAPAACAWRSFR